MRIAEKGAAWGFVDATGFDPDIAIFDNVDAADGVGSRNLVGVQEEF